MPTRSVTGLFDSEASPFPLDGRWLIDECSLPRCYLRGFSSKLGLLWVLCVVPLIALANPEGGQVAAGAASIQQTSPSRVDVVQGSDRAVIDWQGFSIDQGEHTNFQQPSASSVALNRVRGADPSRIDGRLTADGNVYLVNRNGVVFGAGAEVDVAGLVATTADISNENFMQGRDIFDRSSDNPDAEVVNRGRIEVDEGGAVVLAAPRVSNEGEIKARLGRVALAGAETFTVDFHGDGLLQFDVGSEVKQAPSDSESREALVSNSGTIIADGGVVEMSARTQDAMVEQVINMDGVIQARSVASVGGKIILSGGEEGIVAVSGKLDASGPEAGQTGGEVKVLGEKVGLFAGTEIDASGDAGGGEVLVGGNFQGRGPETNAARTYVDEQALIKADANNEGDGGTVVVWADEVTDYRGEISARGGENSGDGGFVEVSGKQALAFEGDVSVGADHGDAGTVLLDPETITIGDTGAGIDGNGGAPDPFIGDPQVEDDATIAFADGDSANFNFQISDEALEGLDGNIVLQAFEDIFVNESLELTNQESGESVVFQAGRNIDITANITTNGAGLHLEADSPHSVFFNGSPQGDADGFGRIFVGSFDADPDAVISTNGGDITLIAAAPSFSNFSSSLEISDASFIDAGSGAVQIAQSISGGSFRFGLDSDILSAAVLARIRTSGVLTLGQATTAGTDGLGDQSLELVANFLFITEPLSSSASTTVFKASGLSGLIELSGGSLTSNGGSLVFQAGGDIIVVADITTNGGALHLEADSPHSLQGAADGSGAIRIGEVEATPDVVITTNGGDISLISSGIDILDTSLIDAGSGAIQIAQSMNGGAFELGTTGILSAAELAQIQTSSTLLEAKTLGQATTAGTDGMGNGAQTLVAGSLNVIEPFTFSGSTTLVAATDIGLNAAISGSGELTLQPSDAATAIGVGLDTAGFDLTPQELANLSNAEFGQIAIGRADGAHTFTINEASFSDPVVFRYPIGGEATVTSSGQAPGVRGSGDAFILFNGSGRTLNLNADIVTSGSPILIADSVLLGADVLLNTTDDAAGANINILDAVNGANALTLTAGTGAINLGVVGDATPLTGLSASGAEVGLQDVTTQGDQSYNGVATFNGNYITNGGGFGVNGDALLAGETQIMTQGGGVTFAGDMLLVADTTVATDNGDIFFDGLINTDAMGTDPVLTLMAGVGNVDVGDVGGSSALGGLDISGTSISLHDVTTQGSQSYSGEVTLGGDYETNGGDFIVSGDALLADDVMVATADGDILFSDGSIDSSATDPILVLLAGVGDINLGDVGALSALGSIAAAGLTVGLQDVTTVGAQDYTGNVTFNSSYATNGGNFTVNGDAVLASMTDITTSGGNVTFGGVLNGANPLTITAGAGGNISFNGDVGLVNPLQAVNVVSGQDVRLNGRFVAGDTRLVYSGALSSINDSLDVANLFLDPGASSAVVFGTVAGASETDAALTVTGPVNDPDFTINGCVIGVSCVDLPITPTPTLDTTTIPPAVDPITPQLAQSSTEKNVVQEAAATSTPNTPTPPMLAINIRRPPSADPTTPQYSNFGNEELWNRRRNESEEE